MKILLFGGTTEGRLLAKELTGLGHDVDVCVATALGAEELREIPCAVRVGRLSARQMAQAAAGYDLVLDATHPYAVEASENIRQACDIAAVPLRRCLREASETDGSIRMGSSAEAADYLRDKPGNVLLTVGSKELPAYAVLPPERLYPRVLPTHAALEACEALHIPHRQILALQGPFTMEMNVAMLRQYDIRFLVSKDGGAAGGFPEKREAARRTGATLILVGRPSDRGIGMAALLAELEDWT